MWTFDDTRETATGPTTPVLADGELIASVTPLWADDSGVRVSVDWQAGLDDLSASQACALAAALLRAADPEAESPRP